MPVSDDDGVSECGKVGVPVPLELPVPVLLGEPVML